MMIVFSFKITNEVLPPKKVSLIQRMWLERLSLQSDKMIKTSKDLMESLLGPRGQTTIHVIPSQ